jgi:flagellar L-ring protein precursor FlgH
MMMRCKALLMCVWGAAFIGLCLLGAAHGEEATLDSMPSLVSDHRAHSVGQNVTVLIYEQAESTTSAGTTTTKSMDISGQIKTTDDLNLGGVSLENNAKGEGSINRTGSLMASVSATVTDVLPTGELKIRGEQKIEFNNEIQYIKVSGHIRPDDIRADNTVLSSRIADAQITYVGDGLLGSRQKPGWITRFFNWLF